MKTYLQISGGVVINMLTQESVPTDDETGYWIVRPDTLSGPGWLYANGELRRPESIPWYLLKTDAFIARFTQAEWSAIQQAANNDVEVSTALQTFSSVEKVHLFSPTIQQHVGMLMGKGLISPERTSALFASATDDEAADVIAPATPAEEP
jgi:hypothetical protein